MLSKTRAAPIDCRVKVSSLGGDGALVIKVVIRGSSALEQTGVTGLISFVCPVIDVGLWESAGEGLEDMENCRSNKVLK